MKKGDVVWNTHVDGSNPVLYRVGNITIQSDGKPYVELCDFYSGHSSGGTEYMNCLQVTEKLPDHKCYKPFK